MRRMNRRVVACLSALMIIFQMIAAPLASALARGTPDDGCNHGDTVHQSLDDVGCGDDAHAYGAGRHDRHHSAPGHSCHCVHLLSQMPAVGSLLVIPVLPVETTTVAGQLPGPAYPSPQFDFLRPPN